jgi:archaellum component FlaF (FlaF/FlaG flagellin family)
MNELMIEILSGLGVLASGFFTKFQTTQNHKEIDTLKRQMQNNEKTDAARDTEIAVLKNQNGGIMTRLDKMDVLLEKIFDKLNK